MQLIHQLLNGLESGSIYALVALGYTMVYGIAKLINFAHGEILMIGAYIITLAMPLMHRLGLPNYMGVFIAIPLCSLLGVLIEKVAYRPLRKFPKITTLITAIGCSLLLQNLVMKFIGSQALPVAQVFDLPTLHIGALAIHSTTLLALGLTLVLTLGLSLFMRKTKVGLAMIAAANQPQAVSLVGVNLDTIISLVFAIGSGLASIGALIYLISYPQIEPTMGAMLGIKAFVAAVIGGVGKIHGAVVGGLILGLIEALTKSYLSSQLSDAVVFAILIIVLLMKPTGLFGHTQKEKV